MCLKEGAGVITEQDIIDHCRASMAHFKEPRTVVFSELPKTQLARYKNSSCMKKWKTEKLRACAL